MNDQHFSLRPFPTASPPPDIKIIGDITRRDHTLAVRYEILGHLAELAIPALTDVPIRKHELWEETCLEFFLAVKGSPQYWEFNLSPAGHWNVYRFTAYRQGMQEELAFASLPFSVQRQPDALVLALELDLNQLVTAPLEAAVSAVIKSEHEVTYWALTHPGSQADFHRRDSFIIDL